MNRVYIIFFILPWMMACATGAQLQAGATVTTNVDSDSTHVTIAQPITVTFPHAILTSSVTASSFFVVPAIEADASVALLNLSVCNPSRAIDASVSCSSSTACTLTPAQNLDTATNYIVCLTADIHYEDEFRMGLFGGTSFSFTTEPAFSVGGTVTGLNGTLVLQNNEGDDLTLTADGPFTFTTSMLKGQSYVATILTNSNDPVEQTCTISSNSGTIDQADITNVRVVCSTHTQTVSGIVSGLNGTVVLQNNSANPTSISANGSFTFSTALAQGSAYAVTVQIQQTTHQTCLIVHGTGTIPKTDITNIEVQCVPYLHAGTKFGNIEISTDGGATWTTTPQPGGNFNYGLSVFENKIYVGGMNGGVSVSSDVGNRWTEAGELADGSPIFSLFILDSNHLYVGTGNGNVALSANGGGSWSLLNQPDGSSVNGLWALDVNHLYAGTANGNVFVSANGGTTWTAATQPSGFGIYSLFYSGGVLYVGDTNSNLYDSNNNGASWTPTAAQADGVITGLVVSGGTIYAGTQNSFFETSTDNGATWNLNSVDSTPVDSLFKDGSTLYAGTSSGSLSLSINDGFNWTPTAHQPGGNLNYGLFITPDGTWYVGGSNGYVLKSTDLGQTWTSSVSNAGLQSQVNGIFLSGNTLYAASNNAGVSTSTDDGNNWVILGSQFGTTTVSVTVDQNIIYAGLQGNQIEVSSDGGNTWPTVNTPDDSEATALVVANGTLYAGTQNGNVATSRDGGTTWTLTATPPDGSQVNGLCVSVNAIYAGTQNGHIEVSTDNGASWQATAASPDGSAVLSLSCQ